jgi:hypothetical protein
MGNFEISVEADTQLSIAVFHGKVSGNDVISAQEQFYSKSPTLDILVDFSRIEVFDVTPEMLTQMLDVAKKNAKLRIGGKTALLFSKDYFFGLGRMYDIKAELENLPFLVRTFKLKDEALAWLSVSINKFDRTYVCICCKFNYCLPQLILASFFTILDAVCFCRKSLVMILAYFCRVEMRSPQCPKFVFLRLAKVRLTYRYT